MHVITNQIWLREKPMHVAAAAGFRKFLSTASSLEYHSTSVGVERATSPANAPALVVMNDDSPTKSGLEAVVIFWAAVRIAKSAAGSAEVEGSTSPSSFSGSSAETDPMATWPAIITLFLNESGEPRSAKLPRAPEFGICSISLRTSWRIWATRCCCLVLWFFSTKMIGYELFWKPNSAIAFTTSTHIETIIFNETKP